MSDIITKGSLIASLDRKVLQVELDRELADYEKVRADFEIFAGKYPDPVDQIDKYLKTQKQATLNSAVKSVELAKENLDMCDLLSPVNGVILDDNSIATGVYITPASSEIKVVDTTSFYFEAEVDQKDIKYFSEPHAATIKIDGLDDSLTGKSSLVYSDGKKLSIKIPLMGENLVYGLTAQAAL